MSGQAPWRPRRMVSPNSKIEWIIYLAFHADVVPLGLVDHGLDLVLGHERARSLRALGDHVADGDQQPGELPEAGEAGEEDTNGATNSAARSVCWTA